MSTLLALDIGGTKVAWAVVNAQDLAVEERGEIATLAHEGGAAVARRIGTETARVLDARPDIEGIAVASAGVVDSETGRIVSATNTMPGWGGTELARILREASGVSAVEILNDVHAHGLGEARLGAGRGKETVLVLAVGTGIGGALIVGGEPALGDHFLAGHFGHIHHHLGSGMPCSCGREGHIEAFCSGSGITAWYESRRGPGDPAATNGRELQALADSGHGLANACFTESGWAIGECLGSLANCLDPSLIVLSGSMTRSGPLWWEAVKKGYVEQAMNGVADIGIVPGRLGGDAPLLGAVLHFLNRHSSALKD